MWHYNKKLQYPVKIKKSPAEKNELLKSVIDKVVYIKSVNGRWDATAVDNFELVLYPKLPKESL